MTKEEQYGFEAIQTAIPNQHRLVVALEAMVAHSVNKGYIMRHEIYERCETERGLLRSMRSLEAELSAQLKLEASHAV